MVVVGGNTRELQDLSLGVVDSGSMLGGASLRVVPSVLPYGALRGRISLPWLSTQKDSSYCCASVGIGDVGRCLLSFKKGSARFWQVPVVEVGK